VLQARYYDLLVMQYSRSSRRSSLPTYVRGPGRGGHPKSEDKTDKTPSTRTRSIDDVGKQVEQHMAMASHAHVPSSSVPPSMMMRMQGAGGGAGAMAMPSSAPSAGMQLSQPLKPRKKDVVKVKLISMGDNRVGKSCIFKRFCEGRFVSKYSGTIGVDYGVKTLKTGPVASYAASASHGCREARVNLFDLAGGREFLDVRNEFYKDAQGAILVFDATSRKTFESLDAWVEESCRYGAANASVFVVANKTDLQDREVAAEEGKRWASANGYDYFEVSAFTGENVDELFDTIAARILGEGFSSRV